MKLGVAWILAIALFLVGTGIVHFQVIAQSNQQVENNGTVYDFSQVSQLQKGTEASVSGGKLVMSVNNAWGASRARLPFEFSSETNYKISFDVDVEYTSSPKVWIILSSNSDTNSGVDNGTESKRLSTILNAGTQITAGTGYKYSFSFNANSTTNGLIGQGYKYFGIFVQSGTVGKVYIDNVKIEINDGKQGDEDDKITWPAVFNNFGDSKYTISKGNQAISFNTTDGNLNVTTTQGWVMTYLLLPFKPENNTTYLISVEYKGLMNDVKVGVYKDKAGVNEFYSGTHKTTACNFENCTTFGSKQIQVQIGSDWVSGENKYLGFEFKSNSNNPYSIKSITISKTEGKVSFVTGLEDAKVDSLYGAIGENVVLPKPIHPDYKFDGWYLEPELINKCSELAFTKDEQILYAKWTEIVENVFDFSDASECMAFNGSVLNDVLSLSNSAATMTNYKQTSVVFPYKLQNNCGYRVEIKYKTNLEHYNLKIGNFKNTSTWDMIQGRTEFAGISNIVSTDYSTQTFVFTTDNKITTSNSQLGIFVQVGGTAEFIIDQVKVTKLSCTVDFVTNMDGFEVETQFGAVGEAVTLPNSKYHDYSVEGWYTDPELINRCETLQFKKEKQVLYAKWEENPISLYDFSTPSEYKVFNGSVANGVVTLSNPNATIKDYKQTSVLFPYELENNCGYRVEIKYKTNLEKFDMLVSNFKKSSEWDMVQGRTEFAGVINASSSNYTVATCTFITTNQVTDANKYFGILVRVGGTDSVTIDEVKITKLKCKISFETGTTESSLDPVYGANNETITLPSPSRRKTHVFDGWYYDKELSQPVGKKYTFNSSNNSIVLYAKWVYGTTNTFDFTEASEYKIFNGKVQDGVLNLSNAAGKPTDYKQTSVVFPYQLENNKTYQVTVKYKTNLKNYSFVVANFKNINTWDMIQDRTTYFKMDNIKSEKWSEKTFTFTTGNEITDKNKNLGILVSVGGTDSFYFDEVSIKCFDVVVNFEATYNNTKIDFAQMGGAVGETITLHTASVMPFTVQGWYYDKALTKPVGKTLTLTNANLTLFGKITLQKKVTIDFEKDDMAGVTGTQYIERIVDPSNSKNHIIRARWDQESYKSNYVAVNYYLLPNHQYKISMKYRIDKPALIQFIVKSGNGKTEWNAAGESFGSNLLSAMIYGKIQNKEWKTAELTFTTEENVDDVYHYLFFHLREPGTGANFDFDDIIIEDMGVFKASEFVTKIDSYEWSEVTDDVTKYNFGNSFLVNTSEKSVVGGKSNNIVLLFVGIGVAVLCMAGGFVFWKLKHKKKL